MTAPEAADALGVALNTVANLVWRRQLRPESGTWVHNWAFSEAEIERRIRELDAANDRRRMWNGCSPQPEKALREVLK